jgi:hypothetical protein
MKKLFLLFTLSLFTLSFVNAQEEKEEEIVYSENIQDSFFGVKFGASREEVIKAFKKEGLYLNKHISNKDGLWFYRSEGNIRFGGFNWNCVFAGFSNGKFYGIQFQYTPEYKETALNRFESVLSALSSRYKMNEMPIKDTNTYKYYLAVSEDENAVAIKCDKGESNGGEMRYYVHLEYVDWTLDKPNDEL